MLKKELHTIGSPKLDLNKLTIPVNNFFENFSSMVWLYDAETLNFLNVNDEALKFFGIQEFDELEGKTVSYLEKKKREQHPDAIVNFAHKVEKDLADTLSLGKAQFCQKHDNSVDTEGYCVIKTTLRAPALEGKKIKGILTINSDATKYEQTAVLYDLYKRVYKNDSKKCNKLFMKYLGLPVYEDFVLTTREIETLIAIAKHRTNVGAAKELGISDGTVDNYVHTIKTKLRNQNLVNILLHFTTPDKRKF